MSIVEAAPEGGKAVAPAPRRKPGQGRARFAARGGRRVRTPTRLQMEATECGAAALGIILAYYGRWVSLEELRVACGVSRDGSRATSILKAARQYGLVAAGYRHEVDELRGRRLPFIVFWNFNHFLVVEGFGKDKVYLNDPGTGPRVVSTAEFDEAFTGVVLACEPGPDFRRGGARPGLLGPLARRLAWSAPALAFLTVAGLGLVALGLVIPAFTRVFVDDVLVGGQNWTLPLLGGMALAAGLVALVTSLQQHCLLRLEARLSVSTSSNFFWHVLRLPVVFFVQRHAGDLSARVGSNDRVARLLAGDLANTGLNLLVIAFYALLMLQYDALLAVIGVVVALLNVVALRYAARRRVDLSQRLLTDRAKLLSTTVGGIQTIETLKASGRESDFFARWAGYHARVVNTQQRAGLVMQAMAAVPVLLAALNTAALLTLGGFRVMEGALSIGMLVAFQSLTASFLTPVTQLVNVGGLLQDVEGDMHRLDDVLRYRPDRYAEEREPAGDGAAATRLEGYLEVKDVTFGYSRLEPPLIQGLSLSLKPGDRVALVGPSGSGKSTVAKLIGGLYEPWTGEILFDGHPRANVARSVLNASLALVDQDIFLFEGTVRENLALWDASIPEPNLIQAAQDAAIHSDIVVRHGGYDHVVEEGGRNFSGGQRQRLEIARALAGNPTLLVLDEATSALDPLTEQATDEALRRRGCTCLIVAHRLSTIRDCDEIIVLEGGRVVQRGTHDEMARVPGPYATLIRSETYEKDRRKSVLERL
jgi:NHLM bacteriocin system ABC transporter peptidase/ATP-binding protein